MAPHHKAVFVSNVYSFYDYNTSGIQKKELPVQLLRRLIFCRSNAVPSYKEKPELLNNQGFSGFF
ncbi:hypothetical protein CLOSTHATH_02453 [Hungatella hathewayi DSM 13479]|uniref:Uncharacterized protein n=1 Tax=Hungatella hathewayi DSM 13479 TaxID=566550 RepID=D3AFR8_9FIRM|nr:hypothetical protein CLOSTHATH_02453 [Hungatella hathewayi DSM 13479]